MKSNTRSKILSVLLSVVMLVSITPIPALAQEDPANTSDIVETQEEPTTEPESTDPEETQEETQPTVVEEVPVISVEEKTEVTPETPTEEEGSESAETSDSEEETVDEIEEESEEIETLGFDQSQTASGVEVRVKAAYGAFPEDAILSVKQVSVEEEQKAEQAIEEVRSEEQNVVASYTFDISILDADGNELQPAEGYSVEVSFMLAENTDQNLETSVYHMSEEEGELNAEALPIVDDSGDEVTALTESFSLFTVQLAEKNNAAGGEIDDNMDRNWNAGTYTLNKNVTINGRVTTSGEVTLDLSSGTLTINGGIYVPEDSQLTIKGSGTLIADARGNDGDAGIGGNEDEPAGTIIIKEQAHVTAWGGEDAAGIGGGYDSDSSWNFIYFYDNCTVNATGNEGGAGIGSGGGNKYIGLIQVVNAKEISATGGDDGAGISGKVIINGGTVNAEGSKGAGIGSNKREDFSTTIEITGGTVTATSSGAAGIGAGLFADFETGGEVIISGGIVTATAGMYSGTVYSCMGSAGIGSSVAELTPGHFSGTVKISGGTVIANGGSTGMNNGNGGAGIGSAFNSNARDGKITITGGRVDAYGGSGAAGIGGGAEDWNNDGGEGCDNVEILGGIVYAASGSIETGTKYTRTSAIGHGDNDGHMGSITFADNMMVQGGWNSSETRTNTPFEAESREAGCQYRWCALIQPCKHQDKTFEILDNNQHLQYCKYCNEKFEPKEHVTDENNKCTICGWQGETFTVTFNHGEGSGTMPSKIVKAGGDILLPSCDFTEPEKQSFYAWEIDGELYPDNVFYTVTKNTEVTALYAQSYPLWVNGIQVNTNNKNDVLGDHTVSFTGNENGGQLILDGALINKGYTFNHDSTEYVAGIYSDLPQLTIQTINPSSVSSKRDNNSQRAYGIFSNHALTLTGSARLNASAFNAGINNGGLLTIQNGDVVAEGTWYGIEMNAGMTVDNSTVTATGTYYEGISSNTSDEDRLIIKGTKTVVTVEGRENGSCLHVDCVVQLQDSLSIVEPAGGYISDGYVYDADGNGTNRAVIRGATPYPVWVGDVQVTSANKDNLCNGAASYDPVTRTLSFTSNPVFTTESDTSYKYLIRAGGNLTVVTPENGLTLNSQQAHTGIYTSGNLTIKGNVDIQVKETAIRSEGSITAEGNVVVQAQNESAHGIGTTELIYASEDIRIEGDLSGVNYNGSGVISTKGSVYVAGDSTLVANYGTLLSAKEDITVNGAVATMKSKGGGVWDTNSTTTGFRAGGSIHMTTATKKWEIKTQGTAMQAKAIYIPATHEITEPKNGRVVNNPNDESWKTIVKGDNVIANNVTIQLKTQPTNVWTVTFRDGTRILYTQTVADGGKVIRPIDLTKEGYEFKGWKSSTSTTAWNFDTDTITTNTTLDALWEVIEAPVITVGMPEDKTWTRGAGDENRTLTVQVQTADNLTYQWYRIGNDGHTGEAIPEATGVNYTVPADTPAGEYQYYCVVTKTQGNGSRSTTSRYATVTVLPDEGDITPPKPINLTYNGTAQKLVRPGSVSGGTLQYKLNEGGWGEAIPTATDAGTYTVYYKIANAEGPVESVAATIGKRKVYVIADDKTKTYGEDDPDLTCYQIGLLGNDLLNDVNLSRVEGDDVGRYKISVTATASNNYIVVSIPGYLTITKAQANVTQEPAPNTLSYTSSAQALVNAGDSTGGEMQYAIGEDGSTAPTIGWSTTIPTATNAGTYYVWYKAVGDSNHYDSAPAYVIVTISKVNPTASVPTGVTATYGQTLADVTLTNPEDNTPGTWAWNDHGSTSVGNVGEHIFRASFTPKDTTNYNSVDDKDVTITVEKADSVVTTTPASITGLIGNGQPQELIAAGATDSGTMQYALGTDATTAPTSGWNTVIPTGTEPIIYYVWYKVVGDANHNDSEPKCITVVIGMNEYYVVDDNQTWEKGSSSKLTITFKAKTDDAGTYGRWLKFVVIDEEQIESSSYDASFGSLKVELKTAYLETLGVGKHTMKVMFSDGSASAVFNIKEKSSGGGSSAPEKKTDNVVTCQMAGYPANYAWNESAKACQAGYIDANGTFRPYRSRVIPNTYDGGLMRFVWINAISLILALACGTILRRNH